MVILFATKEDYVKGFTITKDVLLYGLNIYRERKLKVQLLSETHPLTHLPSYHCYNSAGKLSAKQFNSNTSGVMISYTNPLTLSAHRISSASSKSTKFRVVLQNHKVSLKSLIKYM